MFGWSCMTAADTKSSKASPNRLGQKQHVSRAKCRQSIASDAGTAASCTCVMRKADGMIMDKLYVMCVHMQTQQMHVQEAREQHGHHKQACTCIHTYKGRTTASGWTMRGEKRDPAVSHHEAAAVSATVISWHVGSGAVCLQLFAGCVALWL